VQGNHLCEVAKELKFGDYLFLSRGEEASGGRSKESTLADALEAFIGALYLDQGLEVAHTFISTFILTRLKQLIARGKHKDEKSKFQELAQEKTGIITRGKPTLVDIQNESQMSDIDLIRILGSLKSKSEHPIAHAISTYMKENKIDSTLVEEFEIIQGMGLKGKVGGQEYFVGNAKLIKSLGVEFSEDALLKYTNELTGNSKDSIFMIWIIKISHVI
jgi:cation transport ATPase